MPLNAIGWTTEEDENLAKLVEPHTYLYNVLDPSRKNILARESTWREIAEALSKPVEECKKRWRGLRDGYMRSKRFGKIHKTKVGIFEKLQFLDSTSMDGIEDGLEEAVINNSNQQDGNVLDVEQQVITDTQEYYEITVVDDPQVQQPKPFIKLIPTKIEPKLEMEPDGGPPKKVMRKNCGRKKTLPMPTNITPIKILPKPLVMNSPKIVRYIDEPKKSPEQRSQIIDKLIEKVLKENTNEIDVFFRSMAASVKKLQPNLIPKVKMEVCNVIAKYEMQNFEKNPSSY